MPIESSNEVPDFLKVKKLEPADLGLVKSWSYSSLKVYEQCPYRTYIAKVRKVPEPSSPAADRGTQIHLEAEDYVKGVLGELPDSLKKFKDDFEELRALYAEAKVELEGEWGFNLDWEPTGWMQDNTWGRIKLDALVNEDETSARVIDYKSGKKFGNEIAHSQQCLLYAIATFLRYPHIEHVQTELWYIDHGESTKKTWSREAAMVFLPGIYQRAVAMTTATTFDPKPSPTACKWCSYKTGTDPECQWGVN